MKRLEAVKSERPITFHLVILLFRNRNFKGHTSDVQSDCALLGGAGCLQMAQGPGAKQRCLRREWEQGKPSLHHSAFSDSFSITACWPWPPAPSLPALQLYVLLSLFRTLLTSWSSCKASPSRVSLLYLCICRSQCRLLPEPFSHRSHDLCTHPLSPPSSTFQKGSLISPVLHILTAGFKVAFAPSVVFPISGNGNSSLPVFQGKNPGVILDSFLFCLKLFRVLVQNSRSTRPASSKSEVLSSGSALETL